MIANKIVAGILDDFRQRFSVAEGESKDFEFLVNYLVLSNFDCNKQVDIDLLRSIDADSEGGTFGIDSVQVIVNDNIVLSPSDIAMYSKSNNLKVDLVFVQSKASPRTNMGDVLKTITAARDFLTKSEERYDKYPKSLKMACDIYREVFKFENARHLDPGSPHVYIYFVTTAETIGEDLLRLSQEQEKDIREHVPDIKGATIKILGSNYIIDMYKEVENVVTAHFNFKNKIELDEIDGVSAAYIGYLNGEELLKLISDFQGDIRRWIFYDNVRDFQGTSNAVNVEIERSIRTAEERDRFLLYNNGVTIVAKSLKPLGSNNFLIKDFQVANGCQTSNVIYNNKGQARHINVPVKMIITSTDEIISAIVKANNRQTPVSQEQFITLSTFHRRLQDVYASYSKDMPVKLFYERRSGESKSNESIKGHNIVTLHSIIRCVISTVFKEAYIVYNNNPANILRNRMDKLFNDEHAFEAYYVGNYLLCLFGRLISSRAISCSMSNKYYIIMLVFAILSRTTDEVPISGGSSRKVFSSIIEKLKTEDMASVFAVAIRFLDKVKSKYQKSQRHDFLRDKQFNRTVLEELKSAVASIS